MNLLVDLFGFFFSFSQTARHLPERHRQAAILTSYLFVALVTILCGGVGLGIGWHFGPDPGGAFCGIVSFAAAGFFTGLVFVLYRLLNMDGHVRNKTTRVKRMSLVTAITIPLLCWIGLVVGIIVGWSPSAEREGAILPFVLVLLGTLVGAVIGICYEKGTKAVLAVLGFCFGSYLMYLVVAWLDK